MTLRRVCVLIVSAAVMVGGVATWVASSTSASAWSLHPHYVAFGHRAVCGNSPAHTARCLSHVALDAGGHPLASGSPVSGSYGPADLQSAYALAGAPSGSGSTVAIVDAYDNPNAASDLAAYRSQYGLPACTSQNGCFRKLNENGAASPLPSGDTGWGQEIDLDIEMVSAICPSCSIALIEARSASFSDLATAEDTAANVVHASAISNSYGGSEYSSETTDQQHYNHPGTLITVSSGDNGYGVEFPASSQYVVAVGGTSLTPSGNARGWTETAWSGAGSGCSAYVPKPSWQTDPGCSRRTVADVSAVADPNTGVAVYDSYGSGGANWWVFGGTSVASPIVAGVGARAGGTSAATPYANRGALNDVVGGSNGSCSVTYLCTAVAGYDGPTGLGTPNGTAAFGGPAPTPAPGQLVVNGGFENGSFAPWVTAGGAPTPTLSTAQAHSGSSSALLGTAGTFGTEPNGNSSVYQTVTIPASVSNATLSFWYYGGTTDSIRYDWQEVQIQSASGRKLAQVMKVASNSQAWTQVTYNLNAYRGQTIRLWFNVHQDGYGDLTYMYVDDVSLTTS